MAPAGPTPHEPTPSDTPSTRQAASAATLDDVSSGTIAGDDSLDHAPELHRLLVQDVKDYAILTLDPAGRIMSWNAGAQRIKGYSANEIIGRSFETFYPREAVASGFPKYELQMAARDGRFEDEGWRIRKDGSRFWANVIITALRDPAGRLIGFGKVTRDLTVRREAEEQARLHSMLIQAVKDYAILTLDPDGNVTSWNEGAERIKGYKASEILGRPIEILYPPEAVAAGFPRRELEAAVADGSFEDEGWRVRKDGSRFWASVVITAIRNAAGELVAFGKVTRDLTARLEAEERARQIANAEREAAVAARQNEDLRSLNERLQAALTETESARAATEEAYRELDQFAYIASHDLKAPLRGISSLAQWIEDDLGAQLAGDSAQHMRMLQGRVNRLQALIDGILTYSRAGRVFGKTEAIDTATIVREVIDLLQADEVRIEVAPGLPGVRAERVPLQQIFLNLIGNAVKYTRLARADVLIRVGWRDLGDSFEFSVSDNGPGIAPEFHDRVWGMFQTLEARDKVEGTGIGLAVVKKIVETRGGHVSLESAPERGATFCFTWPKPPSDFRT